MPNADEAFWENVQQESPDELLRRNSHFALLVAVRIIPPTECDFILVERNESVIGDGHTMSVTAEIAENLLRATKGRLCIDDPFLSVELSNETFKTLRFCQVLDETGKVQTFLSEGLLQSVDELSTKDLMKDLHG